MEDLSPSGQMAIFWRILHLLTARYGNYPMGQLLVALTMVFLNERGMPPTLTDLCKATGLPKASVSRYVSWQLSQGLAKETVDPKDRRRRLLVQTRKGKNCLNHPYVWIVVLPPLHRSPIGSGARVRLL